MTVPYPNGFASVVFDCDSTLVRIEGIDELAGPRADEVRRLTDLAMDGRIPLEEVYGRRLSLISPDREQVERLGGAYVAALLPDARGTVAALLAIGKEVRIISGGLSGPVEEVARTLGLGREAVAAVGIEFAEDGSYRGFESDSPLARGGGKEQVIRGWELPRPILLVGDGATDLEARPAVDCFVAFTGVVHRPKVAAGADVVLSQPKLSPVLALAASGEERGRLGRSGWGQLLADGEAALRGDPSGGRDA